MLSICTLYCCGPQCQQNELLTIPKGFSPDPADVPELVPSMTLNVFPNPLLNCYSSFSPSWNSFQITAPDSRSVPSKPHRSNLALSYNIIVFVFLSHPFY